MADTRNRYLVSFSDEDKKKLEDYAKENHKHRMATAIRELTLEALSQKISRAPEGEKTSRASDVSMVSEGTGTPEPDSKPSKEQEVPLTTDPTKSMIS